MTREQLILLREAVREEIHAILAASEPGADGCTSKPDMGLADAVWGKLRDSVERGVNETK